MRLPIAFRCAVPVLLELPRWRSMWPFGFAATGNADYSYSSIHTTDSEAREFSTTEVKHRVQSANRVAAVGDGKRMTSQPHQLQTHEFGLLLHRQRRLHRASETTPDSRALESAIPKKSERSRGTPGNGFSRWAPHLRVLLSAASLGPLILQWSTGTAPR